MNRATSPQVNQERRLAIVEGAAWVMVRVGAGEAEAKLMLGAKVQGISAAAYSTRVPLTHRLALLHYCSAQGVSSCCRVQGVSAAAYSTRVPLTHRLALLHYCSAQGVSSCCRVQGISAAAYSTRVPLTHRLALLHYCSAQGVSSCCRVQGISAAAYSTRVPLTHRLALLHYCSAQGVSSCCRVHQRCGLQHQGASPPCLAALLQRAGGELMLQGPSALRPTAPGCLTASPCCTTAARRGVQGISAAAYSTRVPLTHRLALLHYCSAQGVSASALLLTDQGAAHLALPTLPARLALLHYCSVQRGYYAAAVGPPSSIVCNERTATWQLWSPALEASLDAHCHEQSPVARVAGALNVLIDKMREGTYKGTLKMLSRYAASCALRRRLDRCAGYSQAAARCVVSSHVAHHLLLVLDSLLSLCERGGVAGYVFPVERGSVVRRGARDSEWTGDAACIRSCLMELHQIAGEDIPPTPSESLELAMFNRWENLNKEWKSSVGPAPNYSRRQLRYLWRAAEQLRACKNMLVVESHSNFRANLIQATTPHQDSGLEDLIHILAIMLDQARDQCLNQQHTSFAEFDRELATYRSKKWAKLRDYYDASSACLIDAVRRDPDLREQDLSDPYNLMKQVLLWLHRGVKEDKKYLAPVLKPYLDGLFATSLENSWFLDDFEARKCEKEFEGLKDYCVGVHDGTTDPCLGLLDAAKKLAWAKTVVDFVDRFKHVDFRLVFPTGDGMAISYPVKLPSRREHSTARVLTLSRRDKAEAKLRLATRSVQAAFTEALLPATCPKSKHISRQGSEEILTSVKNGSFWRNATKPDIIPSTSSSIQNLDSLPRSRRRSRRARSTTGFPEISITNQSDTKTMRRKYHTLRSLVYTEPVESMKEIRQRPRSAGNTVRNKAVSRPSLLETLDFINSVKDALSVEESGVSDTEETAWGLEDEWLVGNMAPLNILASRSGMHATHLALGEVVPALLQAGKFTVLQELCGWLGSSSEGALFALHRLARNARSRSSESSRNGTTTSWRLQSGPIPVEAPQSYKPRPPDYTSADEAPTPPPLPRRESKEKMTKRYSDYLPPKRLQELEQHLEYLEKVNSRLNLTQTQTNTQIDKQPRNEVYTGIINPLYDVKVRDKFKVKRSKSLGRSFSTKHLGIEITRYNLTLGRASGNRTSRTNDVMTAISSTSGDTALGSKSNFFQRNTNNVVGDSYRVSRVTID
ncbi:hypothetical protein NE865_16099 [Phthorimaea operculella]|nr:hypothetical protein NE865_16099 [Phthorimaea operculella]